MRCSTAVGFAGRLGGGLTASGCARWLIGLGLTAIFAVGLALVRAARRGGVFFFPTVFLRLAVLVTVVFLRFALALVFVAMAASLTLSAFWKVFVRSLSNKKVSQQARRPSSAIDRC